MHQTFQKYRRYTSLFFALVTIAIGIQFLLFVWQLESGRQVTIPRPPGVEAFLPIGALVSFKYWVLTGVFNTIHPAGLVIILAAVTSAVLIGRGFCSWVCPVGLLSEFFAGIRKKLFKKPPVMRLWADIFLRSIKYILLFFFIYSILVIMNLGEIERFLFSPYNKITDIKMLRFFTEMTFSTGFILTLLVLLSIRYENFWCRYLCPYGALLGLLGLPAVFRIRRQTKTCISCEKCTRVCPSRINVHTAKAVTSPECTACMKCVDTCPVKQTLFISATQKKARLTAPVLTVIILAFFAGIPLFARALGHWKNSISIDEYRFHVKNIDLPYYDCNRGTVADYNGYKSEIPGNGGEPQEGR